MLAIANMLGHLIESFDGDHNFRCPFCGTFIKAEWTTEYGDPLPGENLTPCPKCNKDIRFEVEIKVVYTVF